MSDYLAILVWLGDATGAADVGRDFGERCFGPTESPPYLHANGPALRDEGRGLRVVLPELLTAAEASDRFRDGAITLAKLQAAGLTLHPAEARRDPIHRRGCKLHHRIVHFGGDSMQPLPKGSRFWRYDFQIRGSRLSYSPNLGKLPGWFELLPAPAGRFRCC